MKIIMAPDSFKGALRSPEVAAALAAGWRAERSADEVLEIPLADGGEGTAEALRRATGGGRVGVNVHDALMRPITAEYSVLGDGTTAVMEMAAASGIELLRREELDPLAASTFGAGEVLLAALRSGVRKAVIGIGGSATVDGGAGFLQALGVRFFDRSGRKMADGIGGGALDNIGRIDASALAGLPECELVVACDVTNPLLGPSGAAAVFGPQKGADAWSVKILERNLEHWFEVLRENGLADVCTSPGDGAAGGLGFALRAVLKAEMRSGAELVISLSGLMKELKNADLVVTGEGCSDPQTVCGKLCSVVAKHAAASRVPAVLCSGALRGGTHELERMFSAVLSIAAGPGDLADAIAATEENLRRAGSNLAKLASAFSGKRG